LRQRIQIRRVRQGRQVRRARQKMNILAFLSFCLVGANAGHWSYKYGNGKKCYDFLSFCPSVFLTSLPKCVPPTPKSYIFFKALTTGMESAAMANSNLLLTFRVIPPSKFTTSDLSSLSTTMNCRRWRRSATMDTQ